MYLLRKTFPVTGSVGSTWVPSISGKATDGGVSGSLSQSAAAQPSARTAGTRKQSRQLTTTRDPHSTATRMLPRLCDMFQIENFGSILVAVLCGSLVVV